MSKKLLKVAIPIAAGFIPGLGPLATAAIGAGMGAMGGGGLKGALLGGATAGLGKYIGGSGLLGTAAGTPLSGGLQGPTQGSGLVGALTRGASKVGSTLGMASPSVGGGSSSFGLDKVSGLASNVNSYLASDKAEEQQLKAQQKGIGALQPYADTGVDANAELGKLLGLGEGADQASITEALRSTPGYEFNLAEGTKALDRSAAARGGLFSGRAAKELQQYGQGLADNTYQSAVANLRPSVNLGQNTASQQAGIFDNMGDIKANNTMNQSNIINQAASGLLGGEEEMVFDPATGKMVRKSQLGVQ
jgi:hypothetical protein